MLVWCQIIHVCHGRFFTLFIDNCKVVRNNKEGFQKKRMEIEYIIEIKDVLA